MNGDRITPACAGKTEERRYGRAHRQDHPRVCGENAHRSRAESWCAGSPPRVRGKRAPAPTVLPQNRITPACAGKTIGCDRCKKCFEDHPRVCGENVHFLPFAVPCRGSPPRVRGKPSQLLLDVSVGRITPACAGKTVDISRLLSIQKDHPRVCGENRQDLK